MSKNNYTPFKMKGFSGFGEGTKGTPAKLRPSYKHTERYDKDTDEWVDEKVMISDAEKANIDKQMKEGTYEGDAWMTSATGMSKASEGLKGYKEEGGYKAESSKSGPISGKEGAKSAGAHKKDIVEGLKESATDADVISEEKIQAQKFPGDVKRSQRAINIESRKMNLPVGEETQQRGKEATAVIEKKKKDKEEKTT